MNVRAGKRTHKMKVISTRHGTAVAGTTRAGEPGAVGGVTRQGHRHRVRLPGGAVIDDYFVLEYPTWANVAPSRPHSRAGLREQEKRARGVRPRYRRAPTKGGSAD